MTIEFTFITSYEVFVSAQFTSLRQTPCVVLNDIAEIELCLFFVLSET